MDETGLIKHNPHALITHTGIEFDPFDVKPGDVCIEDIAHALARICRFGGHVECPVFHSVAAHSSRVSFRCGVNTCAEVENTALYELNGLLHDATEAYLGDIVRPLKYRPEFTFYQEVEEKLNIEIMSQLGVPMCDPAVVRQADNEALLDEIKHRHWKFPGWTVPNREKEFLSLYYDLKEKL